MFTSPQLIPLEGNVKLDVSKKSADSTTHYLRCPKVTRNSYPFYPALRSYFFEVFKTFSVGLDDGSTPHEATWVWHRETGIVEKCCDCDIFRPEMEIFQTWNTIHSSLKTPWTGEWRSRRIRPRARPQGSKTMRGVKRMLRRLLSEKGTKVVIQKSL